MAALRLAFTGLGMWDSGCGLAGVGRDVLVVVFMGAPSLEGGRSASWRIWHTRDLGNAIWVHLDSADFGDFGLRYFVKWMFWKLVILETGDFGRFGTKACNSV
jgi:hypothetical protein